MKKQLDKILKNLANEIQKEFQGVVGEKLRPDVVVHLPDKKDIYIET